MQSSGPAPSVPSVLCLTTSFPRDPSDPAGHFVFGDCEARARSASVEVVAPRPFVGQAPFVVTPVGGGQLFAWPGAWARLRERPWRLLGALPFLRGVRRIAADRAPTLLVAHWWLPTAVALFGRTWRAPIELRAHGADVRLLTSLPGELRAALVEETLRCAAGGLRVVFAAHELVRVLLASLPPSLARELGRLSHVEPPELRVPSREALASSGLRERLGGHTTSLFCAVGRLVPEKRFDLALDALRALRPADRLSRRRLVIVGDGPARRDLERRAPDEAIFVGALPRVEALRVIAASDALVHPSAQEAAPSVVREARALGVPVVACAAGDVPRWAASDDGIRIARAEPQHIAALLRGLEVRR